MERVEIEDPRYERHLKKINKYRGKKVSNLPKVMTSTLVFSNRRTLMKLMRWRSIIMGRTENKKEEVRWGLIKVCNSTHWLQQWWAVSRYSCNKLQLHPSCCSLPEGSASQTWNPHAAYLINGVEANKEPLASFSFVRFQHNSHPHITSSDPTFSPQILISLHFHILTHISHPQIPHEPNIMARERALKERRRKLNSDIYEHKLKVP